MNVEQAMAECPVVAIIRGVKPDEVLEIAEALHRGGIRVVEVPLNSPDPLESIARLVREWGDRLACGAGTVLSPEKVDAVADTGAQVLVSPNTDPAVIRRAVERGLTPMPGFGSASEAFTAYAAGARWLKLFPASSYGPAHVKALRAVLPADAKVLAVGGAGPSNMAEWLSAGAAGFGLGSELYRPGQGAAETLEKARAAVAAARRG